MVHLVKKCPRLADLMGVKSVFFARDYSVADLASSSHMG